MLNKNLNRDWNSSQWSQVLPGSQRVVDGFCLKSFGKRIFDETTNEERKKNTERCLNVCVYEEKEYLLHSQFSGD